MIRLFITLAITTIGCLTGYGQQTVKSISNYIETAKANSPLLKDYRNQLQIGQAELQQLKAMYTRSRLELNGDYLFVPILVREGGKTFFRWNEQDAVDYYGYDLGESSGHLHVGATWTQPLLGYSSYKVAREQSRINMEIVRNNIRMEENQLERAVTEQYLLCLLDQTQMAFAGSIDSLLKRQTDMMRRLAKDGLAKQSDLCLLVVEREANADMRLSSLQSYHTHLMELNLLCGIDDTTDVVLTDAGLYLRLPLDNGSLFTEQRGSRCVLELPDGKRLRATVQATLATMDEVSQSEKIVATAADAPFLPEGMNVKAVFISASTTDSAMLLPKSAVQSDETLTSYWVMKLIDDSTAIKVPVETGNSTADTCRSHYTDRRLCPARQ